MSLYRNQLEDWLKTIEVNVESVLDIGGGELPIKKRLKSFYAAEYKILDSNAQYNPDYFYDMNKLIDLQMEFDIVFCLEVFEYLWNPVQAIDNIYDFLNHIGIAYISFPTIYPLHNPPGIDYLRYSKNAIEKLLSEAGFTTWEITPRVATTGMNYLRDFYMVEGMHPMKNTMEIYDIGYLVKAFK